MTPELLARLKQASFPYEKETWLRPGKPTQICLHHTASGPGIDGDKTWWENDGQPVSTFVIIGRDGIITQLYPSERWAYTLGLKQANFREVEAKTIGIEIDTWGHLHKKADGKYYSWAESVIPESEVCVLEKPWRGQQFFHKYTPEQIVSTKLLLQHLCAKFGIPTHYKGALLFNLYDGAMNATVPGIYSHASFRSDKTDIHPQPDMMAMLQTL